ncbi:calpain-2 catalytic subunit-like isoform X2 [Trichomycterus rosablanca]|uniref:calpain-2 catalytic subunit-like isoform X2 n=1 Tax=Trichomycterus rosablanca TaxID=2290929 RepID=UPI002F352596
MGNTVGTPTNPQKFLDQDYEELRRDSVESKSRFVDETFPPDKSSIGQNLLDNDKMARVKWIRPTNMVKDPYLVVKGESRFDFAQGDLGDCWFLAAIGAITFQKDIMDEIIPENQSFSKDYAGIFHFRFWRFGKWVDVVIDDKLPTINGKLIFVHCKTRNEFWPALLEKAYAKVCGSYADLRDGLVSEALRDFTGRVFFTLTLEPDRPKYWSLMKRAAQHRSLMGCGSRHGATSANTELPNGIVERHAYTITDVHKVLSNGESVKLVRLLNPWGRKEWKGQWSARSPLWKTVSAEDRTKLLDSKEDGEFWMSMEDFCRNFAHVDICCRSPVFLDDSSENSWTRVMYEERWEKETASISRDGQTFWMNPQYWMKVPHLDENQTESQSHRNVLVSLMQEPKSRHRRLVQNHPIGFSVFMVPPELRDQKTFPASFFTSSSPVKESPLKSGTREVVEFFRLRPGWYLIVPFTSIPNLTASFFLTVHTNREQLHS